MIDNIDWWRECRTVAANFAVAVPLGFASPADQRLFQRSCECRKERLAARVPQPELLVDLDKWMDMPCGRGGSLPRRPQQEWFVEGAFMRYWCAKNLPKKAIETATRARCNRSSADGTFWELLF